MKWFFKFSFQKWIPVDALIRNYLNSKTIENLLGEDEVIFQNNNVFSHRAMVIKTFPQEKDIKKEWFG